MISKSVNQFLKLNLKNECSVNSVSLLMVKLVNTLTVLSQIFGIHCKIHQKVEHVTFARIINQLNFLHRVSSKFQRNSKYSVYQIQKIIFFFKIFFICVVLISQSNHEKQQLQNNVVYFLQVHFTFQHSLANSKFISIHV